MLKPHNTSLLGIILAVTFFCVAHPASAATLTPFEAIYEASMNGSAVADASRALTKTAENEYSLTYKSSHMLFSFLETSKFKYVDGIITPLYFESKRTSLFKSKHKSIQFDWTSNTANFEYKKKNGSFTLEPGTTDPLTMAFVVAHAVAEGKTTIDVLQTDDNNIETRHFTAEQDIALDTRIGKLNTIKVTRLKKGKPHTFLWLAPELNYLAVKIRQEKENGESYELNIKDYKKAGK